MVGVCGQRLPCLSWFQALERMDMNKYEKYKKARSEYSRGVWTAVALLVVVSSTRKDGHE